MAVFRRRLARMLSTRPVLCTRSPSAMARFQSCRVPVSPSASTLPHPPPAERRRHNFVPLLLGLMGELAKHGALGGLLEAGRKKAADAQARMRAHAKAAKEAEVAEAAGKGGAAGTTSA